MISNYPRLTRRFSTRASALGFSAAWILAAPLAVDAVPVSLQNATATHSQADGTGLFNASRIIDGDLSGVSGWAILSQTGQNNTAVFETQSDIGLVAGSTFTFTFQQLYLHPSFPPAASVQHTMGRFRLSITTDDRSTFADGLQSGGDVSATWTVLDPVSFTSQNGATLTEQPDMSILANGFSPDHDVYNVTATTSAVGISGIRLEMLADPSLPQNGPGRRTENGNFVLTEMSADVVAGPLGDYNRNGTVDSADYVVWRKGLGITYTQDHYNIWRAHFGETLDSGAGTSANAAVPEPTTLVLIMVGTVALLSRRRGTVS